MALLGNFENRKVFHFVGGPMVSTFTWGMILPNDCLKFVYADSKGSYVYLRQGDDLVFDEDLSEEWENRSVTCDKIAPAPKELPTTQCESDFVANADGMAYMPTCKKSVQTSPNPFYKE